MAFMDDFSSVFLVLRLTRKRECIFWLSIGNLVDPEPLIGGPDQARKMPLDILNIVEFGCKRILNINNDDLPVGLALIQQRHDTKNLDLLDLTNIADLFPDFAYIERIIVTLGFGLGMLLAGVLPGLRESTIVPDITMMRETVADEAQTVFF